MNAYREDDLIARLEAAEEEVINPLHMRARRVDGRPTRRWRSTR
jgi:NAD+ kinase